MKQALFILTGAALCGAQLAHAQSSATLWGALDAGITAVNNQRGGKTYLLDNGIATPNLWGVRGTEDLGGGRKAVFELVDQFNIGTGAIAPTNGGGLFSRNAFVGLSDQRLGRVTFGQQYDFMIDSLLKFDNSIYIGGLYGFRAGPFEKLGIPGNPSGDSNFDRMSGSAVSNSVKYTSVDYGGLTFGALYSFGGVPGAFGNTSAQSLGADYTRGPLVFGLAYTYVKYAALGNGSDGIRNWGFGMQYALAKATFNVLYTNTENTLSHATINVYQVGARYQLTPAVSVGGDYELMRGNAVLTGNRANQFSLGARYAFSKRTSIYVESVYQHVSGPGAQAWIMSLSSPSSTSNQVLLRTGVMHRF